MVSSKRLRRCINRLHEWSYIWQLPIAGTRCCYIQLVITQMIYLITYVVWMMLHFESKLTANFLMSSLPILTLDRVDTLKLRKHRLIQLDNSKFYFTNCVVNFPNNLPDHVVMATGVATLTSVCRRLICFHVGLILDLRFISFFSHCFNLITGLSKRLPCPYNGFNK